MSAGTPAIQVKYASNVFLVLKTMCGNLIGLPCREIGNCGAWGVMNTVSLDPAMGKNRILPRMPYGGPCLVKDSLVFGKFMVEKTGLDFVKRMHEYNELIVDKIIEYLDKKLSGLRGRRVAVLGVSYKPSLPEVKDSPAIRLCKELLSRGATVYVHDVNEEAVKTPRSAKVVGVNPVMVLAELEKTPNDEPQLPNQLPFGDGRAGARIVDIVLSRLEA